MIKSVKVCICLFFLKINKKMLHENQAPSIMFQNGHQVPQLLGH